MRRSSVEFKEKREAANKLAEAEMLLHPYNAPLARDIRTLEIELLRELVDGGKDEA